MSAWRDVIGSSVASVAASGVFALASIALTLASALTADSAVRSADLASLCIRA